MRASSAGPASCALRYPNPGNHLLPSDHLQPAAVQRTQCRAELLEQGPALVPRFLIAACCPGVAEDPKPNRSMVPDYSRSDTPMSPLSVSLAYELAFLHHGSGRDSSPRRASLSPCTTGIAPALPAWLHPRCGASPFRSHSRTRAHGHAGLRARGLAGCVLLCNVYGSEAQES